jgi:hypothetical protein
MSISIHTYSDYNPVIFQTACFFNCESILTTILLPKSARIHKCQIKTKIIF